MDILMETFKPSQNQPIFFERGGKSFKKSEFCEKLSLMEKGQITSLDSTLDIAIYKDIIPHPRDASWDLYQLVWERNSLVYNAINNTADFGTLAGFDIDASSDAKKKVMDWMNKVNFELTLPKIFQQLQIFGNSYLNVSNMDFPKLLPPKTMFVKVQKGGNDDGKIIGYVQIIKNGMEKIDFEPEEIIHFKYNDCCNSFYGMSELKPVLGALTRYVNWTEDLGEILHRFAAPYIHHAVGVPEMPANQAQMDDYTSMINSRLPGEDLVTSGAVEIKVVQGTQGMMQMDNMVKMLQDEIIAGLRIPEIFARGGVTSNKAVGDIEMQAFDRKVKALQTTVSILLEDFLFPKITKRDGSKVKLIWNEFSTEGEKIRAERIKIYAEAGMPLKTALKIVGLGTWLDELDEDLKEMPQTDMEVKPFAPKEKEMEMMVIQYVSSQKDEYREPSQELPHIVDLETVKAQYRNPKVKKNAS